MPPDPSYLRSRLLAFFDAHARDLPWRETDDPYAVWVSEIMLQQTRVDTVVPYYRRWMERFPDVDALATADQDEVLKEWEGLGYYSRARNLHRAAGIVRERLGGELPADARGLRELPGVGEYTSGAVASIAFGQVVPAVDGNVRRVLSRLFDLEDPGDSELRSLAAGLVDPERPGDFNQALMELGATVCTPADPDCQECPVADGCLALARGTVSERPQPRKRTRVRQADFAVAVAVDAESRFLMERRPEQGLLGGMWAFPEVEVATDKDRRGERRTRGAGSGTGGEGRTAPEVMLQALTNRLLEVLGFHDASGTRTQLDSALTGPGDPEPVSMRPVRHTFSHIRARYLPWLFRVGQAPDLPSDPQSDSELRWASTSDLSELALPVAQKKIWDAAREYLANVRGA